MAKKGQLFKTHSPEFKISVIMDMREHHLSYHETVRKYWLTAGRSDEHNYISTVKRWERAYLEEGAEGLMKDKRGRNSALNSNKRGRPPKFDKNVEEDLIAENQRLRMEIDYLKKLSALVLAEERKNGKKR